MKQQDLKNKFTKKLLKVSRLSSKREKITFFEILKNQKKFKKSLTR